MELIKNLNWRYATKKFDPIKKVSDEHLDQLKEAVTLSVSSYGLQLYKVLIVNNKEIREQLQPVSWNQSQITDASHLFVFCNYKDVTPNRIDEYIQLTAKKRQLDVEALKGYSDFMKMKLAEKTPQETSSWLKSQTYLALGNLLTACAELKIDACPMEGFDSDQYNDILGLDQKGLNASVVATIGYRHDEDHTQNLAKIRKPSELLFEEI
ncbi:NAD(P)H-dependent oxidoreductase [Aquimarina longa]|uniref:NAD(P)H-dependent oxidoreductase n=1 Tax=Aquimarina longa TaxID=1080221 RepID=UPI00078366CF|nr:NAD(P)H-dependent oxidoreductase [Aquimarina longa]